MKDYLWGVFILINCLFTGCDKKQCEFDKKHFKEAMRNCLNSPNIKWRMGIDKDNKVKNWVLNGSFKIIDTLKIDDRNYRFDSENLYIKSDSTLLYKVTYPDKNSAHIFLKYIPSPYYMITGDFYLSYVNENWQVVKQNATIHDGRF